MSQKMDAIREAYAAADWMGLDPTDPNMRVQHFLDTVIRSVLEYGRDTVHSTRTEQLTSAEQ